MGVGQAYLCRRSRPLELAAIFEETLRGGRIARTDEVLRDGWQSILTDAKFSSSGAVGNLKSGIHTDSSLTVHQRGPIKIRGASKYLPDKITEILGTSLARDKESIRKVLFLWDDV